MHISAEIFSRLGFSQFGEGPRLAPPTLKRTTEIGRRNRAVLLKAWVELSAWLSQIRRQKGVVLGLELFCCFFHLNTSPPAIELRQFKWSRAIPCINTESARPLFTREIGSDPERRKCTLTKIFII